MAQTYSDPASPTHIKRSEEATWFRCDEFVLGPHRRGTPKVGELVLMVPLGPQHQELSSYEECGSTMAGPLGDIWQGRANRSYAGFDILA